MVMVVSLASCTAQNCLWQRHQECCIEFVSFEYVFHLKDFRLCETRIVTRKVNFCGHDKKP